MHMITRYLYDMGSIQRQTFQVKGLREEPQIATRIEEYRIHLVKEGIITLNEVIVVGIRGGGIALVKSIPEVLEKACQRTGKKFKRGDITIVVDVLKESEKLLEEGGIEYVDYIRNMKQLKKTILLGDVVIPVIAEGASRSKLFSCVALENSLCEVGLGAFRMAAKDVEMLNERGREIFPTLVL